MTPRGKRCAASPPEVTVPVVTSISTPRARMRSIKGSTLASSPTLTACSQTKEPAGRAMRASPRRSEMRARCYLPRLRRRASNNGTSGVTAADNSR